MKTFRSLYDQIKRYKFGSVFFGNFLRFFMLIAVLTVIISIITYVHFNQTQNTELSELNTVETKKDAKLADNLFREAEYIASNLIVDEWIGIYISDAVTEESIGTLSGKVQDKLSAYLQINEYIDSIYVYSAAHNKICTATAEADTTEFPDSGFLEGFDGQTENFAAWTRLKQGKYPYLITFGKKRNTGENSGGVIVNINVEELTDVLGNTDNNDRRMYIIADDGKILYSKNRSEYMLPYSANAQLKTLYDNFRGESGVIDKHIASVAKSEYYGWSYAVVSSVEAGKARLNGFYYTLWIIIGIMLALGLVLAAFMGSATLSPVMDIAELLENPEKYDGSKTVRDNEMKHIEDKIMFFIYSNENLKKEIESRNAILDEIQLYALQQQINPHFINNTINIINLTIVSEFGKNHKSAGMLRLLSKQLNNCLRLDNILVTLEEEIENTRVYVELLKYRSNKFDVVYDIDDGLKKEKTLKMILQPLVENAMFHGFGNLSGADGRGKITIGADRYDEYYRIRVEDNGAGMSREALEELREKLRTTEIHKTGSIGIVNVNQRLKIMFGEKYGLTIESEQGKGTVINITLPL